MYVFVKKEEENDTTAWKLEMKIQYDLKPIAFLVKKNKNTSLNKKDLY